MAQVCDLAQVEDLGHLNMRKNSTLWAIALVLTLASAVYQRVTGPSYPVRGTVTLGGETHWLRLERTHVTTEDQVLELSIPDREVTGEVRWRRYPSSDAYRTVTLERHGDVLETALPRQPPAGKLEYQVLLQRGVEQQLFPPRPAVTRFKNAESLKVLIPHVFAMFMAMLLSTRAGLAAVTAGTFRLYTALTLACLIPGGFVLGPIMQQQAFGDYWTGIPFGWDLTDNKTLIALVVWLFAAWTVWTKKRGARWAVAGASLVMLLIFMIPHSTWGSEIRWDGQPQESERVNESAAGSRLQASGRAFSRDFPVA